MMGVDIRGPVRDNHPLPRRFRDGTGMSIIPGPPQATIDGAPENSDAFSGGARPERAFSHLKRRWDEARDQK
jgi:hypothetical protein